LAYGEDKKIAKPGVPLSNLKRKLVVRNIFQKMLN